MNSFLLFLPKYFPFSDSVFWFMNFIYMQMCCLQSALYPLFSLLHYSILVMLLAPLNINDAFTSKLEEFCLINDIGNVQDTNKI